MKIAVQIPIKSRASSRVPNKNFRSLSGKPLCYWLLDELCAKAPADWDIYIDSEDQTTFDKLSQAHRERFQFFQRNPWFAADCANGNHLIHQFAINHIDYDIYIQLYVTAVTLSGDLVVESVTEFINQRDHYDSMFLVTEETGWFWLQGQALNYDPRRADGLPRSQDAVVMKETTGLYAITKDAVLRTACRIGNHPMLYAVQRSQAMDIDTMEDLREAEITLSHSNSHDG